MLELVSEIQSTSRHHPLPAPEHLPELFAEHQIHRQPGNWDYSRPPQRFAQRLREDLVRNRIRRGRVDDAADLLVLERPEQDADLVGDVDPGDVLATTGQRSAD